MNSCIVSTLTLILSHRGRGTSYQITQLAIYASLVFVVLYPVEADVQSSLGYGPGH
jgi:hypothetical protein